MTRPTNAQLNTLWDLNEVIDAATMRLNRGRWNKQDRADLHHIIDTARALVSLVVVSEDAIDSALAYVAVIRGRLGLEVTVWS